MKRDFAERTHALETHVLKKETHASLRAPFFFSTSRNNALRPMRQRELASNNGGVSPPTTPKGGPDAGGHGEVGLSRRWFCCSQASFQSNDAVDPENTNKIKKIKKKSKSKTSSHAYTVEERTRGGFFLLCFAFCFVYFYVPYI